MPLIHAALVFLPGSNPLLVYPLLVQVMEILDRVHDGRDPKLLVDHPKWSDHVKTLRDKQRALYHLRCANQYKPTLFATFEQFVETVPLLSPPTALAATLHVRSDKHPDADQEVVKTFAASNRVLEASLVSAGAALRAASRGKGGPPEEVIVKQANDLHRIFRKLKDDLHSTTESRAASAGFQWRFHKGNGTSLTGTGFLLV